MVPMNGGYESNLVATVFCYKTIIRKEEHQVEDLVWV